MGSLLVLSSPNTRRRLFKTTAALLIAVVASVSHNDASAASFPIYGIGASSCSEWLSMGSDADVVKAQWFLGFVSGHNVATSREAVVGMRRGSAAVLDLSQVKAYLGWIDQACRTKPAGTVAELAGILTRHYATAPSR